MEKQLKTRQICLFFITFMPITKLFAMPSIMASISDRSLYISGLINVLIDLLTLVVLVVVSKKTDKTYYEMLSSTFTDKGAKIISLLYALYFLFKATFPIMEGKDYINATLYLAMPSTFYFLPFFTVALYICTKQLRILGRLADVLFIFTISGFLLLIILSLNNADFGAIFPIYNPNIKSIIDGSYSSLTWFGDSLYFLFFIGNFEHKKGDSVKIILSYLVNAFMIIIFLILFYGVFTFIAFRQRFALTEIAKYTTVISNTGRFDYLATISILFSHTISLCIPLFFASKLIERAFPNLKKFLCALISVTISFTLSLVFTKYYISIEKFVTGIAGVILLIFANVFPILFIFFTNKENRYEDKKVKA